MFATYLSDTDSSWMQSKSAVVSAASNWLIRTSCPIADSAACSNRIAVSHSDSAIHSKGG